MRLYLSLPVHVRTFGSRCFPAVGISSLKRRDEPKPASAAILTAISHPLSVSCSTQSRVRAITSLLVGSLLPLDLGRVQRKHVTRP